VGVLQRFEGRLDQLVNGAFARAFRSEVQPVEVAAALQRELDDRSAVVSRDSTMAPNVFTVELGASDHERLTPYAQALNAEFAAMVTEHAQAQGYTLIGPVEVTMVRVADLGTGLFRVSSASQAGVVAQPQVRPPLITEPAVSPQPASSPAPEPALTTNARLVINDTGFPLTASVVTIGRGSDAGIRIDDPGISRHHAEIRHGESGFSIIDLASTNGTLVAGERIGERALTDGDEIRMGSTLMVFRSG
jgi:predicted component of type VI protein secretion system